MPRRSVIVVAVALVWLPSIAAGQRGVGPITRDLIGTWHGQLAATRCVGIST